MDIAGIPNKELIFKSTFVISQIKKYQIKVLDSQSIFIPHYRRRFTMKVRITEQCMGDRNCNKLCPEVFEYDEDQLLSIVKFDEIPDQYKDIVRQAAEECGADAIIIDEDD